MDTSHDFSNNRGDVALGLNGHVPSSRESQLVLETIDGPMALVELAALVEALLLVAPASTTVAELARGAGVPDSEIEAALAQLESRAHSGWVLQRHGANLQITTAPRFATHVRRFLGLDRESRLSGAALETLAIVAYQQPVTKSEVEAVRGVDCSGVLHTLLQRSLIEQLGRLSAPGNPIQYGTTPDFLLHFGLKSLADLPSLGQIQGQDARSTLQAIVITAEIDASAAGI